MYVRGDERIGRDIISFIMDYLPCLEKCQMELKGEHVNEDGDVGCSLI